MTQQTYPYARIPFRKRRPVLFFFLLLVALFVLINIAVALWSVLDDKGVFSGPKVGVVTIDGFIADAEDVVDWMEKLRQHPSVAGVLVRINSPGGAVAPSQEAHAALKRLAAAKPVIVSMGAVAASGGYYIAVAGKEIFASPSTLTGSIGVRLQVANVQRLMERIGVGSESLVTGSFKAAGSPFQTMTAEERAYLQELLDDMQDEFVSAVAEGRRLSREELAPLTDGRAFTGRQALQHKLVDSLGGKQEALERLTALCGLASRPPLLKQPEKSKPFWKSVLEAALDIEGARAAEGARYVFCY